MINQDNQYFANKEGKDTADILLERANAWVNTLESNGYQQKLKNMWRAYHGAYYTSASNAHKIMFSGEQGELVNLPVNHLRNLAQHMLVMTTSNRPSMEARATNTDYKSLAQAKLANGILDYYMREKRLEKFLKNAVESAIVMGSGYIRMEWDSTAGEVFDYIENEETGTSSPIYDGDVKFTNLSPMDVVVDGTKENQDHDWILIRTYKNKYDLAAKYPEFDEKIRGLETKNQVERFTFSVNNSINEQTDDVYVYEFYHRKTDAVPDGRYMLFLDKEIILQDRELPYRTIPVFRISPSDILGTPHGYSPIFDILPMQDALNSLYSTVLTNQNAFGVQNIWVKEGNNLNVNTLDGGLNIIQSMEKPESLNLTQTPKEIFDFINMLVGATETISGVNSVSRGNADSLGSNPSGTAMALIQSMALQFMSGLQASYVQLIEDVGTALINILKDYANTPRLIAIAGKSNRTELKSFSSDEISNVSRVVVDMANPLAHSTAGRVQMADNLLQYQLIKSPQQYLNVLNTGNLDTLTEDIEHELLLIKAENETLVSGEVPPVTFLDDHKQHLLDHRQVLADPELRKDAGLVDRVRQHVEAHINELRMGDPALLGLLGQQALPPQNPQQSTNQPQGGPPQGSPSPSGPMNNPSSQNMAVAPTDQNPNSVSGPGIEGGARIAQPAKPPGQFSNLPVNMQQMAQQGATPNG